MLRRAFQKTLGFFRLIGFFKNPQRFFENLVFWWGFFNNLEVSQTLEKPFRVFPCSASLKGFSQKPSKVIHIKAIFTNPLQFLFMAMGGFCKNLQRLFGVQSNFTIIEMCKGVLNNLPHFSYLYRSKCWDNIQIKVIFSRKTKWYLFFIFARL